MAENYISVGLFTVVYVIMPSGLYIL